jgi:hypothetical protein
LRFEAIPDLQPGQAAQPREHAARAVVGLAHAHRRDESVLDDLFGVLRAAAGPPEHEAIQRVAVSLDEPMRGPLVAPRHTVHERDVKLERSRALNDRHLPPTNLSERIPDLL